MHQVYIKSQDWKAETAALKTKIKQVCDSYYKLDKLAKLEEEK